MAKLWDQIKQLFEKVEQSSASVPATHEVITRTEQQKVFALQFKNGLIHRQLLRWIKDQYQLHQQASLSTTSDIQFIQAKGIEGFVVYFKNTQYRQAEVIALFDELKERILMQGYYCYLSDSRSFVKQNKKEEVQRHYLKPSLRQKEDQLLPQQYGNITIEIIWQNNVMQYLKFSATTYKDHLYEDAVPFEQLMEVITEMG